MDRCERTVLISRSPKLHTQQVSHCLRATAKRTSKRDAVCKQWSWAANIIVSNKGHLYHDNGHHHDDHDECAIVCIRCHYHPWSSSPVRDESPVSTCLLALQCNLIGILPVHQLLAFLRSHLIYWSFPNQIRSFEDGWLLLRTLSTHTHTHLKTIQSVKILSWKSHSLKAKHSKGRNDVRWFSGTFTNRSPSPTARRSDGGGPTPLEVARFLAVSPENCQRWIDGCHKKPVQMIQKSSSQTPVEV